MGYTFRQRRLRKHEKHVGNTCESAGNTCARAEVVSRRAPGSDARVPQDVLPCARLHSKARCLKRVELSWLRQSQTSRHTTHT